MKPTGQQGHDAVRGDVLERIHKEYGAPEEKAREPVKKLGKDEFFKIMVTQIQHQDPLKPAQNEQMAAQMAQFSALEQMVNMNQNLEKLAGSQQPLHHLGAANLIGKYVTADSSRILHTEGKYSDLSFELPSDAAKVHASIINEKGETVRELEAKDLKKGKNKIEWDGRRDNKMSVPSGQYMVQISGQTVDGKTIQVQTQKTAMVHGVGFEGKETVLFTGDVRRPQKLLLKEVAKIMDASEVQPGQADSGAAGAVAGAMGPTITGPGGVQIGGLENLVNGAMGGAPDEIAPPEEEGRVVEGITPGLSAKYMPVSADAFNQSKPEPTAAMLDEHQIRKLLSENPDLSAANPVAEAMKEGKKFSDPRSAAEEAKTMDAVNPLARQMGFKGAHESAQTNSVNNASGQESSPRQSVQSSQDGSTAGQWGE